MKSKKWNPYRILAIAVLILTVILFIYSVVNYAFLENKISEQIELYGFSGIFVLSALFDFLPQWISPEAIIVISGLLGFSMMWTVIIAMLGSAFGSMLGFEIGSHLKKSRLLIDFLGKEKTKEFEKKMNNGGKWILFIAAVSPLPYIPLIFGMLHFSRRIFIIYGLVPRILGFILTGTVVYWIL